MSFDLSRPIDLLETAHEILQVYSLEPMPPEAEIWDAVRPAAWAVEAAPGYDWVVARAVDLRFLSDVLVVASTVVLLLDRVAPPTLLVGEVVGPVGRARVSSALAFSS